MKWIILLMLSFVLFGCNLTKNADKGIYIANINKDTAILMLEETKTSFYGSYEVRYGVSGKDSGVVRGEIIGDTLKGKYDYFTYAGNKKWAPFVLLRKGAGFKLGSGVIMTLMNIPYFDPQTLQFKKSDFQFAPITNDEAKRLNISLN